VTEYASNAKIHSRSSELIHSFIAKREEVQGVVEVGHVFSMISFILR